MTASARQIRDVSYERRRASILRAAREVFSRLGFAAATVDDVAERAGIAKDGGSGIEWGFGRRRGLEI